jgi:hypothetical protein
VYSSVHCLVEVWLTLAWIYTPTWRLLDRQKNRMHCNPQQACSSAPADTPYYVSTCSVSLVTYACMCMELQGFLSHLTLQRVAELRKAGTLFVLVTGARSSTLLQRLPYLPAADAFASENGARRRGASTAGHARQCGEGQQPLLQLRAGHAWLLPGGICQQHMPRVLSSL